MSDDISVSYKSHATPHFQNRDSPEIQFIAPTFDESSTDLREEMLKMHSELKALSHFLRTELCKELVDGLGGGIAGGPCLGSEFASKEDSQSNQGGVAETMDSTSEVSGDCPQADLLRIPSWVSEADPDISPRRQLRSQVRCNSARHRVKPDNVANFTEEKLDPDQEPGRKSGASCATTGGDGVSNFRVVPVDEANMVSEQPIPQTSTQPSRQTRQEIGLISSEAGYDSACREGRFHEFVQSSYFDYISAVLVILNSVTIGVQADSMAQNDSKEVPTEYRIIDLCFCFLFTSELLARIYVYRMNFFCSRTDGWWNLFDFTLVCIQLFDEVLTAVAASDRSGFNFSFMRIIRILRLVRIMRLFRVLRLISDLRAIVSSILSSLQSLLWTVLLLFLLLYVFAVFMTQLASEHRVELKQETSDDRVIADHFGSLGASILSLYQAISGGVSWRDSVQPVIREIGLLPGIVIICYIGFATLAVLNVVTGVFVQTALRSAQNDEQTYMLHHVQELFAIADKDDTGVITWDAFVDLCEDPRMAEFFEAIDVDQAEAPGVFHLLDSDDSGEIDLDEFLHGCLNLHGPAKAIHLSTLMMETRTLLRFQVSRMKVITELLCCLALKIGISHKQLDHYKPDGDLSATTRQSFAPNCPDLSSISTHVHSRESIGKHHTSKEGGAKSRLSNMSANKRAPRYSTAKEAFDGIK
jgi:voltage-gated sodium channel